MHHDWSPRKQRERDTRTGWTPCEQEGKDHGDASTDRRAPRLPANQQKLGERLGTDPASLPRGNQPCGLWSWTWNSETVTQQMSAVYTTQSVILCYGSPSKLMQGWELSSRKPNRSSITNVQSRFKAKTKIKSRISPGNERLGNLWKLFRNLEDQCFSFLFLSFF